MPKEILIGTSNPQPEVWKPVVGYEDHYEVSNLGRVRICKIMKPWSTNRYLYVGLSKNHRSISYTVHRLVAQAFIPNPENDKDVNHKNGNKGDNRAVNLEWTSRTENIYHAIKLGLMDNKGERNPIAKLSNEDIRQIRYLSKTLSQSKLGKMFKVSQTTIGKVLSGITWKHI